MRLFLSNERPFLIKLQRPYPYISDLLIMNLFADFAGHTYEPSHCIIGHMYQPCGGLKATPFVEMIDHRDRFLFCNFGIEKRTTTAFRKLLNTMVAAQVAYMVMTLYLAYHKIAQAALLKILAVFVHTAQTIHIRSRFHRCLLSDEKSSSIQQRYEGRPDFFQGV